MSLNNSLIEDFILWILGILMLAIIIFTIWFIVDDEKRASCRVGIDPMGIVVVPDGECGEYKCSISETLIQDDGHGLIQVIRRDGSPVPCRVGVEL